MYSVRTFPVTNDAGELCEYRAIVICDEHGTVVQYTGLEQFSRPYTGHPPLQSVVRTKCELTYICAALNWLHENVGGSLSAYTAENIYCYFGHLTNTPIDKERYRSKQTLQRAISSVSAFFANLACTYRIALSPDDLMKEVWSKSSRQSTRVTKRYFPIYTAKPRRSAEKNLVRDVPLSAVRTLVEIAEIYDPMLTFAIVLGISTGLRPAEVMNVRQEGSPLSAVPGISISYIGASVRSIAIDLTREYVLRADGKNVGKIKKERTVPVYPQFIPELMAAYKRHLVLLQNAQVDARYMPMFVNRSGHALTYATYSSRLQKLVHNHWVPRLLASSVPEDVALGQLLTTRNLGPHAFRHCFSVRLALENVSVAEMMHYRGDTSPESALTYLQGKGELVKKIEAVHDIAINALSGAEGE
ncbi:hypothetical protein [Pseudoscardovia suis]